jgi:AraC-like DNA-binding protein
MQLANLKIGYAENLLLTTNKTIKQIAAELNYQEENTFVKFFIYHKKMSPSQYRKRIVRYV